MRELEFLPNWYPQTRRRKRVVILQAYMTLVLACGLGLFMFLSQRNVRAAEGELSLIHNELHQTASDLKKLDEMLALKNQLQQKRQVIDKLGTYVDVTHLLSAIQSKMPPEMAMLGLSVETIEQLKAIRGLAGAAATAKKPEMMLDRKLQVTIRGVAPSHVDVANFVVQLSNVPFFEQVSLGYGRDKTLGGHIVREFEVTFFVNLNSPATTAPPSSATVATTGGK